MQDVFPLDELFPYTVYFTSILCLELENNATMAGAHDDDNGPLFLGLDVSTQSHKASLLSADLSLLSEVSVNFDKEMPHYGTQGGVLQGKADGEVFSPVMMAVESFDHLADKIIQAQWPTHRVRCVSAAGQQHASVYWSRKAPQLLAEVKSDQPLLQQLDGAFSRQTIPNWQDSATTQECKDFEAHMGGADRLASITGSRAYERFTGPQILRFRKQDPEGYKDTERVSLVSSFVTTMLCMDGEVRGIDESDACGMNLWDLSASRRGWNKELLELVSGNKEGVAELEKKLGAVESDGGRIVGRIGSWWQQKLGFSADCFVCPATGDNPATLLSFALSPREALVSLGTSDTLLLPAPAFKPSSSFHVFYHPARVASTNATEDKHGQSSTDRVAGESRFFNMLVYKNGSLAREAIRNRHCQSSWQHFDTAVRKGWPSSTAASGSQWSPDNMGFYWLREEIIPANAKGIHLYKRQGDQWQKLPDESAMSGEEHASAIVSSQLLNYQSRVGAILDGDGNSNSELTRLHASGGASSNLTLLQSMADVLHCDVVKPAGDKEQGGNACSVGAAFKARWGWERATVKGREDVPFDVCMSEARSQKGGSGAGQVTVLAQPDEQRSQAWRGFVGQWQKLEERALQGQ
ncbi:unnamed protein product [Jaminaea pallidilutea]